VSLPRWWSSSGPVVVGAGFIYASTACTEVPACDTFWHSAQWRRSVTLVDINRLIEDVQTLNDMPPRLQKLEDAKVR